MSDGKTPNERRIGIPFNGPVIPFGAMVEYHLFSGKKVLPGVFRGCVLSAGGIWKGDVMVADIEELEEMDASELQARRINAKEVLTPMKGEHITFQIADGTVKISGAEPRLRTSTSTGIVQNEERNKKFFEENQTDSLLQPHLKMTLHWMMRKLEMISGPCQEISFVAITWNPESNCTCRLKNHPLFHCNTLALPGLPTQLKM